MAQINEDATRYEVIFIGTSDRVLGYAATLEDAILFNSIPRHFGSLHIFDRFTPTERGFHTLVWSSEDEGEEIK